jgi:hypothetical protein
MRQQIFALLATAWLIIIVGCGSDPTPAFLDVSGEMVAPEADVATPTDLAALDTVATDNVACEPGEACDDGDPCTLDDFCKGGFCTGTTLDCGDDLECTHDNCLPDGSCDNPVRSGFCFIADECFEDGDLNPLNSCLECITALSSDDWSAQDSSPCNDGDSCTVDDGCKGGACIGLPIACPEDTPCTTYECVEGACEASLHEGDCASDACADWTCIEGECVSGPVLECNDDNLCTDDHCDPVLGCVFVPNNDPCDDANECTVGDACAEGLCGPGPDSPDCDDGNDCTDDSCHPEFNCVHFPNNALCDDGDPCLSGDFCVGGGCVPGEEQLLCNDDNICTDDLCEAFVGCVATPNAAPCDDGDSCFSEDLCDAGECVAGPTPLDCDDGNDCTNDSCEPFVGCWYEPAIGACDDGNACTDGDTCSGAECIGELVVCNDDNICTTDGCDGEDGCVFTALTSKACRPTIVITYPPRGVTIDGDPVVTVTGTVSSNAGDITSFTINGSDVAVGDDGAFAHPITSLQGMNLIIAEAVDSAGGQGRTAPSYYFSTTWYQPDVANPASGMVPDGIMAFLGPEVWDDNDTSDVDDLATIMTLYLQGLDLSTLLTNPVTTGTQGWCNYKVNVSNMTYGEAQVDLSPIDGGLYLLITIPDFSADIQINMSGFLCPSVSGKATATSITIDANVLIAMVNDELTAEMVGTSVTVNGLNIQLDGIWGFLLNWLVDFFEDQFASQLEAQFESQLGAIIPATIVDALSSLALDQSIPVAPFLGGGDPLVMQLKTELHSVDFKPEGAALGLRATVVVPKDNSHSPLGSIGRADCLGAQPGSFGFPKIGQLELALHDDFFNQLPYAMYWGGLFEMDVAPADLGVDLGGFGLTDVNLHVDFLLPTILTSCTPDGQQVLQIGDMRIDGTMKMAGVPVEMTIYASVEVAADIVAIEEGGQQQLSVALGDVRIMEVEVTEISGPLAGAEQILVGIIEENLVGGLLDSFSAGALGSFPIPSIDLSGFDPSIPPGSGITLDLQQLLRVFGYTVLSGNVQ